MKKRAIFLFSVFMLLALEFQLFAFGRREAEAAVTPINPEWTLVITEFDVSAMSPAWQTSGDAIARNLVAALQNVNFRLRGEDEYIFHRDLEWARVRRVAANTLVTRRNERDQLIFRGEPYWRHERALRTAEERIVQIEEEIALLEITPPTVEQKPAFRLHARNLTGVFPPPPEPERENHFLIENSADAFLTGRLSEFHGRMLLEMQMFTRHTASFSFEDLMLFSPEDFDIVLEEIAYRVVLAVSGSYTSTVFVQASPSDAMVLIDGRFIGLGEIEHILLPGEVEISVQAENFASLSFPLELEAGDRTEVFVSLSPLSISAFGVDVPDRPGSRVYQGGLFVGKTPLTLELPRSEFSYITVETEDGEIGAVIVRDNTILSGSAQFVRVNDNYGRADFITAFPIGEEERQVARARNSFYRAYGALWFALPAGLLAAGFANNHLNSTNPGSVSRANMIRMGANGLIGAAIGTTFFQIFRYIRASGREAMPLARIPEPIIEEEEYDEDEFIYVDAVVRVETDPVDTMDEDEIQVETEGEE